MTSSRFGNRLLMCLTAADSAAIARHLKIISLDTGTVLQEQDAPVRLVFFPVSGVVSLLEVLKDGVAVETAMIGREGCVGLSADFGPWHACARAVVQARGAAECIPASLFREVAHQNRQINGLMLRYKEALCAQIQQTAACNARHSVEQRTARWILQMLERIDSGELTVTQEAISQILGVRRTTVTIAVGQLQEDGLIHCRRGHIEVTNSAALRKVACECFETSRRRLDAVFQPADHAKASAPFADEVN